MSTSERFDESEILIERKGIQNSNDINFTEPFISFKLQMKTFVYPIARKSLFLILTIHLVAIFYLGNSADALSLSAEATLIYCEPFRNVSDERFEKCQQDNKRIAEMFARLTPEDNDDEEDEDTDSL